MSDLTWMLYGATGYTGQLVAAEAVRRGHRPLLAGRSQAKLARLAARLDLEYVHVPLHETELLQAALRRVELVYHAAGPYTFTAAPMINACLATRTHYLDLSGEINVIENTFALDEVARQRGVLLMSSVGFDVIPTDCLALYVAQQVPDAIELQIGFDPASTLRAASAGTARSMLEVFAQHGGLVRRAGQLEPLPVGQGVRKLQFTDGTRSAMPIPWGDLSTAYRTTGIRNITVYMAFSPLLAALQRGFAPLLEALLRWRPFRRVAHGVMQVIFKGPAARRRETGKAYVWARAADGKGNAVEAWLETAEGYQFTVLAAVAVVERVLDAPPGTLQGALTPAGAFGADFVMGVEGVERFDGV